MRRHLGWQKGSVMVEFALVLPLLLMILLGIMVLGMTIHAKIVVSGAAREAGRCYSVHQDVHRCRQRALDAINSGNLKLQSGAQQLFAPHQDVILQGQGDHIRVTVTYRYPILVPFLADLIDSHGPSDGLITLRSQAVFRIEK